MLVFHPLSKTKYFEDFFHQLLLTKSANGENPDNGGIKKKKKWSKPQN